MASLVWGVQDLVVEYREVKCETETDWVGWGKIRLGDLSGVLVCLEGLIGRLLSLVSNGELGEVTVVITLPLETVSLARISVHYKTHILW